MALEAGKFRQAIIESTLRSCQLFVGLAASDIEALGEEVRTRVKTKSGVTLEWEIKRIGIA